MNRPSVAIVVALFAAGCGRVSSPTAQPFDVPDDCGQVLLVTTAAADAIPAEVRCYERRGAGWVEPLPPTAGVVGRSGVAPPGEKREGDGRTPTGTFRLGPAFGYAERIDTKLDYRQATDADVWVDDPHSPDYNRWVTMPTAAASFEKMRRDDDLYEYGAVIGYNTDPVAPGRGSAIFLHVWRGAGRSTDGCVAVGKAELVGVLRWLDRAKNPAAVIRVGR